MATLERKTSIATEKEARKNSSAIEETIPENALQESDTKLSSGSDQRKDHVKPTAKVEEKLEEAVAFRRIGGFAEARSLLLDVEDGGEFSAQIAYQLGILYEVEEEYSRALEAYQAVVERWPEDASADDARFRAAYCLEEVGEHRAALRAVRRLQRSGKWDEDDGHRIHPVPAGRLELRTQRFEIEFFDHVALQGDPAPAFDHPLVEGFGAPDV